MEPEAKATVEDFAARLLAKGHALVGRPGPIDQAALDELQQELADCEEQCRAAGLIERENEIYVLRREVEDRSEA